MLTWRGKNSHISQGDRSDLTGSVLEQFEMKDQNGCVES